MHENNFFKKNVFSTSLLVFLFTFFFIGPFCEVGTKNGIVMISWLSITDTIILI